MLPRLFAAMCLLGPLLAAATAQPPDDAETLAAGLKPLLVAALPPVLYEKSTNWGHQELAPAGLRARRKGITEVLKNDGKWRKLRMTTQELPRTLTLKVTEFQAVDAERQTFKVFLAFQAGVEYEHQTWDLGLRLWSGSIRARLQLKLALDCENLIRVETGKGPLPDIVFRLRVVKAAVTYDNFVVEHINGIGGSAARLTGEALRSALRRWKPALERDLLARADAAIVKAADTREVRIGLGGLGKKK